MHSSHREYAEHLNKLDGNAVITVKYELPFHLLDDFLPFRKVVIGIDPALAKMGFGVYGENADGRKIYVVGGYVTFGEGKMPTTTRICKIRDAYFLRHLLLMKAWPDNGPPPGDKLLWKIEQQRMSAQYNRNLENTNVMITGAIIASFIAADEQIELVSAVRKLCKKSIKYYGLDPEDPANIPLKGPKNRVSRKKLGMKCAHMLLRSWGGDTFVARHEDMPFYNEKNEDMWDVSDAFLTAAQEETSKEPTYRPPTKTTRKRKASNEKPHAKRGRPAKQLKERFNQLIVSDDDE